MSSGVTDPIPADPAELTRGYEAAMQRAARHEGQQQDRRARISRRQFLSGSWHPEQTKQQEEQST